MSSLLVSTGTLNCLVASIMSDDSLLLTRTSFFANSSISLAVFTILAALLLNLSNDVTASSCSISCFVRCRLLGCWDDSMAVTAALRMVGTSTSMLLSAFSRQSLGFGRTPGRPSSHPGSLHLERLINII